MSGYELEIDGSKVYLLGIVKGLVDQGDKLEEELKKISEKIVVGALPISEEELEGLKEFIERDSGEGIEIEPSSPEKVYAEKLSRFGEVSLPPPSYTFFLKYCTERDIEVEAFDMDEDHYTMAYCDHVSGTQWIRQTFREKTLSGRSIDAETPEEFALKWDRMINKLSGFQELQKHREKIMAKNITRFSKRGVLVALVEEERIEGVLKQLEGDEEKDL